MNRDLPQGYARRPAARTDVEALAALWRRSDESLGISPEPAASFLGWLLQVPYVRHHRDTVVVEDGAGSAAVGIAMRDPASVGSALHWFGVVDPAHRGRGIGAWLVSWGASVARARADERPFSVRSLIPAPDDAAHELLTASGYEQVRTNWDMAIELTGGAPPVGPPPAGVRLRTFETGRDERTMWMIEEAAFAYQRGIEDGSLVRVLRSRVVRVG